MLSGRDIETKASLERIEEILKQNKFKVKNKKGVLTARRISLFNAKKSISLQIRDAGDERIGTVFAGPEGDIEFRVIWKLVQKG